MGRRKIRQMPYGECNLCDYKSKSNRGMILHLKYSHGSNHPSIQKNDRPLIFCGMCKKKNCKIHL